MKNKEMFIDALSTLFHSWGSDTPAEVIWGANELMDWYEKEYKVQLGIRFQESFSEPTDYLREYEEVIEKIRNT